MLARIDKMLPDDAPDFDRKQALFVYRKITILRASTNCGMCGTTRYNTRPFWNLGMRVCKECLQANMVSNMVLYERFWISLGKQVDGYATFVDAIAGRVFFFYDVFTVHQRLEITCDRIDFPGGRRGVWFFWMPHLRKVLDMDKMVLEAREKHRNATFIRAYIRRCLVLRALSSASAPQTIITSFTGMRKDCKRTAMARLRKTELLDKVDPYIEQRVNSRLKPEILARLNHYKDRRITSSMRGLMTSA